MKNLSASSSWKVQAVVSYLPVPQEVQCYLYILQFVESHASLFSGLREKIMDYQYITYLSTFLASHSFYMLQEKRGKELTKEKINKIKKKKKTED